MDFGRVAVLMGGRSAERGISLASGGAVLNALSGQDIDARGVDAGDGLEQFVQGAAFDRVFIAMHGRGGEDGTVQGFLETLGIPFTGSGVMASALAMDKYRSKLLWRAAGLPTPDFMAIGGDYEAAQVVETVGLPLIVKPVREGSSFGISKVTEAGQLAAARELALGYDSEVLAESWIEGREFTAAILDGEALPLIELVTPHEFYDYAAKYTADTTRYLCPVDLGQARERELQALATRAFAVLGASGWGRVDFMLDSRDRPWLVELNTVPGLTDHSLVPMAAQAAGIDFSELARRILATSIH